MNNTTQSRIDNAAVLVKQGNLASAHFALKKILRKEPDNIAALILNAEILLRSGRYQDSADETSRLFELDAASFNSTLQLQLGHLCFENELFFLAAQLFEWVKTKKKADVLSLYRLGISLRRLGEMYSAEQSLLQCIKLRPGVAATYLQLGHVYKATGHIDRAEYYYKRYITFSATEKGAGYWSLADLKSYTFSDDEIAAMKREVKLRQEELPQSSALYFALGWAAEQKQNYSEALDNYNKGNAIQARLKPFHAEHFSQLVSELQNVKGEENPVRESDTPVPIFIVGLPRSGTTLIEQILSAHSKVQATDELPFLERIALKLEMSGGYGKRLSALSEEERKFLKRQYLNGVAAYLKKESDYFIDKFPGNYLHIGLIKRIMPESIIIDVRRDPRDTAISAYRQLFNAGNEFSASFDGIHEYYKGYLALIKHWQFAYPNQIKVMNYEQLVTVPLEEIQSLLDFCGLESEPGCFEFYKHKRAVMTPSVIQVLQPMYTSSIGQWRHYEEYARDDMLRLGNLREVEALPNI